MNIKHKYGNHLSITEPDILELSDVNANKSTKNKKLLKAIGATVIALALPTSLAALKNDHIKSLEVSTLDTINENNTVSMTEPTTTEPSVVDSAATSTSVFTDTTLEEVSTTLGKTDLNGSPELLGIITSLNLDSSNIIRPGDEVSFTLIVNNPDDVSRPIRIISNFSDDGSSVERVTYLKVRGCSGYINSSSTKNVGLWGITLLPKTECVINFGVLTSSESRGFFTANAAVYDDSDIEPCSTDYVKSATINIQESQEATSTSTPTTDVETITTDSLAS